MTIDRRTFVQTATAIAVAAAGTQAAQAQPSALSQATTAAAAAGAADPNGLPDLSSLDPKAPPAPRPDGMAAPSMRRFDEQRWILDNIIRANGIDWDQPRLPGLAAALGPEATTDIAAIRTRVQKFADIAPAFEAVARRREARAIEAAKQEDKVGARDNFFMAANFWGGAQWPIDENNAKNIFFNQKKRECYLKYAKLADHQVEPAWIALDGKSLPGWFHLPYGSRQGSGCRAWSRFRAWTATRSAACRSPATAFCRAASRSSWSRARANTRAPCWASASASRPGRPPARRCSTGWRISGDRCRQDRHHRLELRIAVFHHRGIGRAALRRGGGGEHAPRAGMRDDLPAGVADLQEALHVHVGNSRRGRVRQIPPDADVGGSHRQHRRPVCAWPARPTSSPRSSTPNGCSR